jgi:hypothetical protein
MTCQSCAYRSEIETKISNLGEQPVYINVNDPVISYNNNNQISIILLTNKHENHSYTGPISLEEYPFHLDTSINVSKVNCNECSKEITIKYFTINETEKPVTKQILPFVVLPADSNAFHNVSKSKCSNNTNICSLAPATGPSQASFVRFFYNPISKQCEQFFYGGCLGNANNFKTIDDCLAKCKNSIECPVLYELNDENVHGLWNLFKIHHHKNYDSLTDKNRLKFEQNN